MFQANLCKQWDFLTCGIVRPRWSLQGLRLQAWGSSSPGSFLGLCPARACEGEPRAGHSSEGRVPSALPGTAQLPRTRRWLGLVPTRTPEPCPSTAQFRGYSPLGAGLCSSSPFLSMDPSLKVWGSSCPKVLQPRREAADGIVCQGNKFRPQSVTFCGLTLN